MPTYTVDEGVAPAQAQSQEIAIARKKVQAACGGFIEACPGFLPSVASTGFYDKRQQQKETRLRDEDYNAILRVEQNYVRGEVNEEDVGEMKLGMKAKLQLYPYRTRTFIAHVASIQPAADPVTQPYIVVLEMENPPDNLMAEMTGEMNIITGTHKNVLLVPTRAILVDQALIVKHGIAHARTAQVGFRTLDFSEAISGLAEGNHVVVSDQDKLHPGEPVRQRMVNSPPPPKEP